MATCVFAPTQLTLARDDRQARTVRLLLLEKGTVAARRVERPFAAGMDEQEQSGEVGPLASALRDR
jgi:hypothetical protein